MLKIISDSTCNLAPETIEKYGIRIAPISIQFDTETYEEDIDIDRETFYRKIEELKIIPKTSQPSPAWFEKYYKELVEQQDSGLVITITQKHSGTFDSATLAKSLVPEADVEVFDSASISLGTGWMILEVARGIEAGMDRADILKRLKKIRASSSLYLTPSTLKYLQMSGRVGKLQGALASLLNVKPVIYLQDGLLEARENVRTRQKALERILELTEQSLGMTGPINLAVIHAQVPDEGQQLLEKAQSRFEINEYLMEDLVASLAVHGGPGVIGLFAYPA
jgi:DegV family protein with EDD domain